MYLKRNSFTLCCSACILFPNVENNASCYHRWVGGWVVRKRQFDVLRYNVSMDGSPDDCPKKVPFGVFWQISVNDPTTIKKGKVYGPAP